jgi:hypothetical protein
LTKVSEVLRATRYKRAPNRAFEDMTGRGWFQLIILVLALIIWASIALLIKLRNGQSWKTIFADERLWQLCFGLSLVMLVAVFAIFMYVNN